MYSKLTKLHEIHRNMPRIYSKMYDPYYNGKYMRMAISNPYKVAQTFRKDHGNKYITLPHDIIAVVQFYKKNIGFVMHEDITSIEDYAKWFDDHNLYPMKTNFASPRHNVSIWHNKE